MFLGSKFFIINNIKNAFHYNDNFSQNNLKQRTIYFKPIYLFKKKLLNTIKPH